MRLALHINARWLAIVSVWWLVGHPISSSFEARAQESRGVGPIGPARSPWPKMLGTAGNTGLGGAQPPSLAKPWLFETLGADRTVGGSPALDADGTLYIGADSLYALDGATGRKRWELHVSNIFVWPAIVGFRNTIYASTPSAFCALDSRTGSVRWRFQAHKEPERTWDKAEAAAGRQNKFFGFAGSGALSADSTIYVTSLEGNLYALDSETGREKWRFSIHQQIYSSPVISPGGTVYFAGNEKLYAVDGKSGKEKWEVPHCWLIGPVGLGVDGTIYINTFKWLPDGVHQEIATAAIESQTGALKWEFPMGKGAASVPTVGADGTIYVGFADTWEGPSRGKIYAIDGKSGGQKWASPTQGGVLLPPAIGSDGTVYVGSKGGVMYALDGATGSKKWEINVGAAIGTPAAIGGNGLMYFGANDGIIYAVHASDGAVAPRPK